MAKTLTVYLAADLKNFNQGMDDASRKAGGLGNTMSSMVGPALIAAAAAAGAFALKIGVDGVKAAIEDEAAAAKLAKTLENVGQAHNTEAVEDYISSLERSLGVADDELRPAYDRLIRSIGDTTKANQALSLALDISAGTGKSLDAVVQALGRAYDGNTAGLSRLGAGIDSAVLKSGDMQAITAELSATFSGQAQTSARTFEGQIRRLSVAADNLKEAFGAGLLSGLGSTNSATDGLVDSMEELEPAIERVGEALGSTFGDLAFLASQIGNLTGEINELIPSLGDSSVEASTLDKGLAGLTSVVFNTGGAVALFAQGLRLLQSDVLGTTTATQEFMTAADGTQISVRSLTSATVTAALSAGEAKTAFNDLRPAVEESGKTALEAAGSYLALYERIAAADKAARDFANTSGTVTSAIAQGTRNTPGAAAQAAANATRSTVTEDQVARAIQNLVTRSDARQGRSQPDVPFLVLK